MAGRKSMRAELRRRADYALRVRPPLDYTGDPDEYESNPGGGMYAMNPYGESPLGTYALPSSNPAQTHWGAGGGHYDGRAWHPGGGRFLSPAYLGRPPYDYHPGGGHRSHGGQFFPGSGYNSNPYGESPLGSYASPYANPRSSLPCARCGLRNCPCGCAGDPSICICQARSYKWNPHCTCRGGPDVGWDSTCPEHGYSVETSADCAVCQGFEDRTCSCGDHPCRHYPHRSNPYGPSGGYAEAFDINPPQTSWGAGGGYYDRRGRWRAGGGRRLETRYLGRPPYDYHPGGGQYNRGFHPGAGYNANPRALSHDQQEKLSRVLCGPAAQLRRSIMRALDLMNVTQRTRFFQEV